MSEIKDFVDEVEPTLTSGTWTNLGHTPHVIGKDSSKNKSLARGNKNERVEVKNETGSHPVLTFNGEIDYMVLRVSVTPISTSNSDRNKMKADILNIMTTKGYPYPDPSIDDNPKKRNKEQSSFLFEIIV